MLTIMMMFLLQQQPSPIVTDIGVLDAQVCRIQVDALEKSYVQVSKVAEDTQNKYTSLMKMYEDVVKKCGDACKPAKP